MMYMASQGGGEQAFMGADCLVCSGDEKYFGIIFKNSLLMVWECAKIYIIWSGISLIRRRWLLWAVRL